MVIALVWEGSCSTGQGASVPPSTSSLFSDALMLGGFGPVSPGYGVGFRACLFLSPEVEVLREVRIWQRGSGNSRHI